MNGISVYALVKEVLKSVARATDATNVANHSYRVIDRSEGGGIVVEVSDDESKTID